MRITTQTHKHHHQRRHQKQAVTYNHRRRRPEHYNPPILDSAQSPHMALGRTKTINFQFHHIPLYPIHIPPIPHDAMIQRQSPTRDLRGGFMKTERTLTRRHACVQSPNNSSPLSPQRPTVVGWRSPRETPPQKPLTSSSELPCRLRETDWPCCSGLPSWQRPQRTFVRL